MADHRDDRRHLANRHQYELEMLHRKRDAEREMMLRVHARALYRMECRLACECRPVTPLTRHGGKEEPKGLPPLVRANGRPKSQKTHYGFVMASEVDPRFATRMVPKLQGQPGVEERRATERVAVRELLRAEQARVVAEAAARQREAVGEGCCTEASIEEEDARGGGRRNGRRS
jgi:hypothetical protein